MMNGTSVLHVAASNPPGSLDKLLRHSHIKTLINATDNRGATPLIVAVLHRNIEGVRSLLENGAKTINHLHETGQTALHISATLKDESILEEILIYNDSPYFLDSFDKKGNTALLTSSVFDTKCSQSLLKAGANHHARNKNTGRNILHLAVLYQRLDLIEFLVTMYPEKSFIASLDANGYSPLKIALELKDVESAMILLRSIAGERLVAELPDALIMTITIGKEALFNLVLELSSIEHLSSYCNDDGESALTIAVSGDRAEIVDKLIQKGVKVGVQKSGCRKSIFDMIEGSNNVYITRTILESYIKELGELSDKDKQQLRDIVIRKSPIVPFIIFQQSDLFDDVDGVLESSLFLAARTKNYGALLFLLLSTSCSQRDWMELAHQSWSGLLRLYYTENIYASDIYILTGILPEKSKQDLCPSQTHLFRRSKGNRNIFHACALGGSLNVVIFVYQYCHLFHPNECQHLDEPDETGCSPLLLSIRSNNEEVAAFLIQKGANLIKTSKSREHSIQALTKHIPGHTTLLVKVMDQSVIIQRRKLEKGPKSHPNLSLDLKVLCPVDAKNITDVGYEICKLHHPTYQDVICHPLLDYFVWHLWQEVGPLMKARFYTGAISTFVFSLFITLKYSDFQSLKSLEAVLWWLSLWFAKLNLCFHLPIFYLRGQFVRRLLLMATVVVPLMEIIFLLFFNSSDRTSLEIGGTAILGSWMNLLFHGVAAPNNGVEISTIWIIFREICSYAPTFFVVAFAFTLYLFTLFNHMLIYNNPLHAFLYTAFHIRQGSVVMPSFLFYKPNDNDIGSLVNSTNYNTPNVTDLTIQHLNKKTELRTMLVEGCTVLFYMLVASALSNMLTRAAIRAGKEHSDAPLAGIIARKLTRIREWEMFAKGKFHDLLYKCKALWVVGVPTNIKEVFAVPKVLHPTSNEGFDMFKMKDILTEDEDLVSNKEIPYLQALLRYENIVRGADNSYE
ncbi:hypothetical protein GE061_004391 [Apolygus lucorum]|uniref:Ion transport domain-containing protein n=1 Tax=Apolygus lucorum TaxID=248454 RepID=A0A8S9X318_APOLU|nr:hypothetical protein GE061_004391 [Apolygus lucorum]